MARRIGGWMLGVALLACSVGAHAQAAADGEAMDREMDDAIDVIQQRFMKEMTHAQIVERALKALLEDLDPYSNYLTPLDRRLFDEDMTASFGGMGVNIDFEQKTGAPAIRYLMVESPGGRAGLRRGDRIARIDGHATDGADPDTVVGWMRGTPGSIARLEVLRADRGRPLQMQIKREVIHMPSVRGVRRDASGRSVYMLDAADRIGYIRISRLADDTPATVEAAMESLRAEGLRGLVLDLRDCIGGKMQMALGVADLFIDHGRMLTVVERDKSVQHDATPGAYAGFPIVALVNKGTASSGEILAGALKDNGRVVLVGERTFGKGRVQELLPLGDGRGSLKLSTGTFQRPSGKTIDRHDVPEGSKDAGIAPDIEVVVEGKEYEGWIEHASLLDSAVLLTEEEQAPPAPDRVLERALLEIDKQMAR